MLKPSDAIARRIDRMKEAAAASNERGTREGREQAGRIMAMAASNAIKRGRPVPGYAKKGGPS